MAEKVKQSAQVQGQLAVEGKAAQEVLSGSSSMPNVDIKSEWWKSAMKIINVQLAQEIHAIRIEMEHSFSQRYEKQLNQR